MQQKNIIWLALVILVAAILVSCNVGKAPEPTPDVNAIYTTVAQTMISQFNDQMTQTAQAIPPSPFPSPTLLASPTPFPTFPLTPLVFNTPGVGAATATHIPVSGSTPGSTANGCNDAAFAGETIPDGTVMSAGQSFDKSWDFQNTGTCTWDKGYAFVYVSGDKMNGNNIAISADKDVVKAGHGQAFIVKLVAPSKAGTYTGYWRMKDSKGNFFGSLVSVKIVVK